jgi:hypothetical protein
MDTPRALQLAVLALDESIDEWQADSTIACELAAAHIHLKALLKNGKQREETRT